MIVSLKTSEEINGFKIIGNIAGEIMSRIISNFSIFSTTNEINNFVINMCREYNVSPIFLGYEGFPAAICASTNATLVHGLPDDNPINDSDLVSIDLGLELNGYIADTAITMTKDAEEPEILKQVKESLKRGISSAKDGNKLSDIAHSVSKCRAQYSIPKNYGGHGININQLHAPPFVANDPSHIDEDITLKAGMILAIEPMLIDGSSDTKVAEDGWSVLADGLSVHVEHTILITKNEPIILTERRL